MNIYDTLIIGSGYSSVGYALTNKNCLIVEETQCCDIHFYLALKSFMHNEYSPATEPGKKLMSFFDKYNLFSDGYMLTNAMEAAFCDFLSEQNINIYLKCRVVSKLLQNDGTYKVTLHSNEGLTTIIAKKIIDTYLISKDCENYYSILYLTENADCAKSALTEAFPDAEITRAFYKDRYAMHIPCGNINDVNEMLSTIHDKWLEAKVKAQILYTAPVFFKKCQEKHNKTKVFPVDCYFDNPIAAFEAGITFAGGNR